VAIYCSIVDCYQACAMVFEMTGPQVLKLPVPEIFYLFFFGTDYKQKSKLTFLRRGLLLLNRVICCTKYKMRAKEIKEF